MDTTAAEVFSLRLQVGRWLPTPLLGLAVALRELALSVVFQGGLTGKLAPAWVVVNDRSGRTVLRVAAGRDPEAGPELLADMRRSAVFMAPHHFLERWGRR